VSKRSLRILTARLAFKHADLAPDLFPLLGDSKELSLQARTLRLAATHPDLRSELNRLLQATGNTSVIQQPPIVIQQPPVIVQQDAPAPAPAAPAVMPVPVVMPPVAPLGVPAPAPLPTPAPAVPAAETTTQVPEEPAAPPPVGALFVTERTQKGFEADLLPEMTRLVDSGMPREQVASDIVGMIRQSFTSKDHLYNILIRHQSTFETDEEYRNSLERLASAWVTDSADIEV
jgi:hypothetical protein